MKPAAERVALLERLMEISLDLSSTLDLGQLLPRVVRTVRDFLEAEDASVMLVDPERQDLFFEYVDSPAAQALKSVRLSPGEGIAGRVAATGRPLVLEDAQSDPRLSPKGDEATGVVTRDILCVPLVAGGRTIGTLQAVNKRRGRFSQADIPPTTALANIVAVALENARLHRVTEENLRRITELEQAKTSFIGLLSHELRTPLTKIRAYTELLLRFRERVKPGQQEDYLRVVLSQARHLQALLNDLFIVNEMEGAVQHLRRSPVDVREYLAELVDIWSADSQRHRFEVEALPADDEAFVCHLDREKVFQALYHLVSNAVKFSPQGGLVRLSAAPEGPGVVLAVQDEGIGIPPEEQERIFTKFYQVDSSSTRRFGGMGIGLYLCRRLVEAHGGRVWAVSAPGRGSTFHVWLPSAGR
ncbi:MAG TPA: GAF domain-containing sensor histidine kinase [Candidatus Nitrosotenuis sp.]|nr:GAF domain-containing sensor histidine kinase [Candidatus Nitrosotenuis sp.]